MKKLLLLVTAVAGFMIGCTKQEDMSSPPAEMPAETADTNNVSTNQ